MAKDKRYEIIKHLLLADHIHSLSEVFEILPKTVLARDLGINYQTFKKIIRYPERFTLKKIYQLASLIEVDRWKAIKLIHIENEKVIKVKKNRSSRGLNKRGR